MLNDIYFQKDEIGEFYKNVSKNIRNLHEQNGILQLDLALAMGIKSIAFYSNCENYRYGKYFNLEHIYKISKLFGVDMANLLD